MPRVKAVIFDLDNTLSDFMNMKEAGCRAAVRAMIAAGLQMDVETGFATLMETYFSLGLESDSAFKEFLERVRQFDHKILAAGINAYLEKKKVLLYPYPNVISVLNWLKNKNVIMAIVTDAPKTKAYQRLLAMGIESYFHMVVGFEDTNTAKKSGLPLSLALKILKSDFPDLLASEILMVGDSVERDLQPAEKLGLKTALSKYGQTGTESQVKMIPDHVLNDLWDLRAIIEP